MKMIGFHNDLIWPMTQLLNMKSGGDDISWCVKTALPEHVAFSHFLYRRTCKTAADG